MVRVSENAEGKQKSIERESFGVILGTEWGQRGGWWEGCAQLRGTGEGDQVGE